MFTYIDPLLYALALLSALLLFLFIGHRLGQRMDKSGGSDGAGAINGAVFALLGLLLAFTFSGAASRFDERRALILQEANAISTAYLRLDLLPVERQPTIRTLFRNYLQARLDTYAAYAAADTVAAHAAYQHSLALQQQIWTQALAAAQATNNTATLNLTTQALNAMIDITTSRLTATRTHPPDVIYLMLFCLASIAALLAGMSMASKPLPWLQVSIFALSLSITMYVILDLEYPRKGLIRVDAADQLLRETLQAMPPALSP
jgi:hypothetical protein